MSKMKFTNYQAKQTRVVEGVCMPIWHGDCDYDELLREAVRVALRMDVNPARDDFEDLYERIGRLMAAYIASPEGEGEDTCTLMSRLAVRMSSPLQFEKASNAPLKQRRWRMFVIRRHLSVEALQAELY